MGNKEMKSNDKVVYVSGSFDMFHPGHLKFLKKVHEFGSFVIVGVHDDETVRKYKGNDYPIGGLFERGLCVLSCKYTDDMIMAAPAKITLDMIKTLNISVVIEGAYGKRKYDEDPYAVAKSIGIYKKLDEVYETTTENIIVRI